MIIAVPPILTAVMVMTISPPSPITWLTLKSTTEPPESRRLLFHLGGIRKRMYLVAASGSVISKGVADVNRRLITAVSLLLVSSAAFGQSNESSWIADSHGCRVWFGTPTPNESVEWSGACRDGFAQGRGILQWFRDGRLVGRTDGELRDGKLSGHGVSVLTNGNRYDVNGKTAIETVMVFLYGPTATATMVSFGIIIETAMAFPCGPMATAMMVNGEMAI